MSRLPRLSRAPVEATVDGLTHAGQGVVRIQGKAVFVAGALPGERVRVEVVEDRARWARAQLLEVLDASPDRTSPPCEYAADCGGCDLQHVTPDGQRRLKTRIVREQLARLGGVADPPVAPCLAVSAPTGYRNRAVLHADAAGRLGFHRQGTNEVVPVDRCLVLTDAAQQVREEVGDTTGAAQVTVRAHAATGRSVAVLAPGTGPLNLPDAPDDLLLAQPDASTLAIRGDGVLEEQVAGLTYRFDATSFFQGNTAGAQALVDHVLAAVGDVDGLGVWDLYAGVGLLSLPLARAGADVLAVEGHPPAAAHAADNATRAGLALRVLAEPVIDVLRRSVRGDVALDPPDVVVLDPPRTGAGSRVIGALVDLSPPTIVYVACDVAALARDTRLLTDAGYALQAAQPLELFPMTHHVEVVASFRPASA